MADASFLQTSFLGGEWSPLLQGRADDPRYRQGMNLCRNALPIEEGSATRRPGTRLIAATRKGAFGVIRAFDFAQSHPYLLELTAAHVRFLAGASLIVDTSTAATVSTISTANPASVETAAAHGYTTGDQLLASQDPTEAPNFTLAPILGRELEVTVVDTTHFTIADAVTGASIDGSTIVLGNSTVTVQKIIDLTTPYTAADLQAINTVQDQKNLLLLHGSYKPQLLASTGVETTTSFATFSWGAAVLLDGPYLDPPTDGTTITPSGVSGSVTLTLAGGATRFASTDVGRSVRLFSEPADWAIGTAYVAGNQVRYNGGYYQALKANTGKQPDADIVNWGIATGAAVWNWATITAFTSTTVVTATLKGTTSLPRTTACTTWRLGVYSDTTGYPTCGAYHEGRLWLAGAVGNRVDSSCTNDLFNFQPTSTDGTVADNNGISAIANSDGVNVIFWMSTDEGGLICGTQNGEWRIRSSSQNDPLSPTSIQFKRVTKYGCANVPAKRTGNTITFVERFNKKVIEYVTTDYRGLSGNNISLSGKHLTQKGIVELAYQREKVPVIWARTSDGQLIGCTYKRESIYADQPAEFAGWHAHQLGDSMTVQSIQVGPNYDGTLDTLSMVVFKQDTGFYYTALLTDLFDVDWGLPDAMYVDFGTTPVMGQLITSTNPHVFRFYGLHRLAGQTVDAMIGGIDFAGLVVAADGHLDVPVDNANNLLTTAWVAALSSTSNFHGLGLRIQLTPADMAATAPATGMLQFDTSLGGSGNGVPIPDWDAASGYGKPVLFTSSAATGACALWDLSAQNTPPARLAFHATNAVQGFSCGCVDSKGNFYLYSLSGFGFSLTKLTPDLQTKTQTAFASPTVAQPSNAICLTIGGKDYAITCGGQQVDVVNVTTVPPSYVGSFTGVTDPAVQRLGRLKVGSSTGSLWLVAGPPQSGGAYTRPAQPFGFWKVTIRPTGLTPVTASRRFGLTPQQLGWTHFSNAAIDILGDETDGNPICWMNSVANLAAWSNATTYAQYSVIKDTATGHDYESIAGGNLNNAPALGGTAFWRDLGVTQVVSETRMFKLNGTSGAVIWSILLRGGQLNGYREMSRVRFGKLRTLDPSAFASSNHDLHDTATLTGVDVVTTIWNVAPSFATQFYNDKTGQWIAGLGYGYLAGQPGSPIPQGATANVVNDYGQLVGTAAPYFPQIAPPNAATYQTLPAAIGYTYTTQCQILRALAPDESGARNGPALGKSRRTHMYAALVQQSQGMQFGVTFLAPRLHAAAFASAGGTPVLKSALYSGVHKAELEGDSDYDNMICWQVLRPYPATVCALEGFLHTQDR